ncbi:zinc ribbon domain-containing protein [Dickeya dadantii]|uniref:zinc ribbon domain-containing protein n=1 Tax=Dickeya dadantii TaxID=204038 RepID=UPI001CF34B8A|nr:zinc ribbon domain-containing protein [Dickeya dadantii]MCA7012525.1 zinc ribbon domain-containing protein [Dickeya dadantii]
MNFSEISISFIVVVIIVYAIIKLARNVDKNNNISVEIKKYDGVNNANFKIDDSMKGSKSNDGFSFLKIVGCMAIAIGLILATYAMLIDVSVVTASGYKVNNIGLMSLRQNYIILGGFILIAGLIIVFFGNRVKSSSSVTKCPYCAEEIKLDAIKCKHCGSELNR